MSKPQQMELSGIDLEQDRVLKTIEGLGKAAVDRLTLVYQTARFSYRGLVEFTQQQDRTPQEAGKMFTRFYQGLQELGAVPPPEVYERNRDKWAFPLPLLGAVLARQPDHQDDAYTAMLRQYHAERISQLAKVSTSG